MTRNDNSIDEGCSFMANIADCSVASHTCLTWSHDVTALLLPKTKIFIYKLLVCKKTKIIEVVTPFNKKKITRSEQNVKQIGCNKHSIFHDKFQLLFFF